MELTILSIFLCISPSLEIAYARVSRSYLLLLLCTFIRRRIRYVIHFSKANLFHFNEILLDEGYFSGYILPVLSIQASDFSFSSGASWFLPLLAKQRAHSNNYTCFHS